ncbi:MAG TPA: sigma-54 dependent transcriptional regulator [Candidatus Binatia bacterium]|nr:sigma-54 dependent transcriptional regulator [Candidatus Binatia bacterium]
METAPLHLLLVDADAHDRTVVRAALLRAEPGAHVTTVSRLRAALDVLRRASVAGIVTELRLPDAEGGRIVRELRAGARGAPVIAVTARGSEALAVSAMKLGAADYLNKEPGYLGRLEAALRDVLGQRVLASLDEWPLAAAPPAVCADGEPFVATTAGMRQTLLLLERASRSRVPVLLEGETGTGKELLARAIHHRGARRGGPFVAQNCAALAESLLESELFGHLRGAFTGAERDRRGLFAEADEGTVFLDEIGEAPPSVQAKLLRVIQHGEVKAVGADRAHRVRARIIAATNRPLEAEVAAGRFRGDLYYRLAVFPIRVPPLRHRTGDIPRLVEIFLRRFEREEDRTTGGIAPDALRALQLYSWPGNVRELEHEVHRLVLTVPPGVRIGRLHLAARIRAADRADVGEPLARLLARVELTLIRQRIAQQPTKAAAARSLGITREALYAKLRRLGGAAPLD